MERIETFLTINDCCETDNRIDIANNPLVTEIACPDDTNGAIDITVTNARPYVYDFGDGNDFVASATLNGLDTGDYTVIVRDDSGCTTTLEAIELDERALNIATANITDPSCGNLTDGSIEISADNAVGVLTFDFNDGNGPLDPTSLTRLDSGTYIIDVFDSEGCTGNPVEFTLTKPEPINGLIEARRSSCNGALIVLLLFLLM